MSQTGHRYNVKVSQGFNRSQISGDDGFKTQGLPFHCCGNKKTAKFFNYSSGLKRILTK